MNASTSAHIGPDDPVLVQPLDGYPPALVIGDVTLHVRSAADARRVMEEAVRWHVAMCAYEAERCTYTSCPPTMTVSPVVTTVTRRSDDTHTWMQTSGDPT